MALAALCVSDSCAVADLKSKVSTYRPLTRTPEYRWGARMWFSKNLHFPIGQKISNLPVFIRKRFGLGPFAEISSGFSIWHEKWKNLTGLAHQTSWLAWVPIFTLVENHHLSCSYHCHLVGAKRILWWNIFNTPRGILSTTKRTSAILICGGTSRGSFPQAVQ